MPPHPRRCTPHHTLVHLKTLLSPYVLSFQFLSHKMLGIRIFFHEKFYSQDLHRGFLYRGYLEHLYHYFSPGNANQTIQTSFRSLIGYLTPLCEPMNYHGLLDFYSYCFQHQNDTSFDDCQNTTETVLRRISSHLLSLEEDLLEHFQRNYNNENIYTVHVYL